MATKDRLHADIYTFRHHVEEAINAICSAVRRVPPHKKDALKKELAKELSQIPQEVERGGAPGRLPVRDLLHRLGIRVQ